MPTTPETVAANDRRPDERDATTAPSPRRVGIHMATLAGAVAVTPILVAGLRGALHGWIPTGDDAYSAVRAWDVFTSNPPLLGTWSSASTYAGHQINHPGPLHFDLLALPVMVLGRGAGTALGLALVNAMAVALMGWLVARRLGAAAGALALGCSALLSWSFGSEMLYSPWSQHAPLIPFSLFLVAVWCTATGDLVASPIMIVAGSYVLQTHLSYSVLVPGLVIWALVAAGVTLARDRRREPATWDRRRRTAIRCGVAAAGAMVLCWTQPLVEQLTGEGNLAALVRSLDADVPRPGLGAAVRALGGTVALPPMWLPPSFASPSFDPDGAGRPTALAAFGLLALAAALGWLGWRAHRRGSRAVGGAALVALAALVLAMISVLRMPYRYGLVPTYLAWLWPLGMFLWLVLGAAVLDELRARTAVPVPTLAVPGLVVAVVAGVAALPTVDNHTTPPWTVEAVRTLDDDVVAALEGRGPVLVEMPYHPAVGWVGPPLFGVLQDAGTRFYVADESLVRQLGEARRFAPGRAEHRLIVRGGTAAAGGPGERLVASWSDPSGPDGDERSVRVYLGPLFSVA